MLKTSIFIFGKRNLDYKLKITCIKFYFFPKRKILNKYNFIKFKISNGFLCFLLKLLFILLNKTRNKKIDAEIARLHFNS